MPQLSSAEIDGLMRTFICYVQFPKDEWPKIRQAESDTEEGNRILDEYQQKYRLRFFQGMQETRMDDWDDPSEYVAPPQEDEAKSKEAWAYNCCVEQREYVVPPRQTAG